ncbi:pseudouridine synthase, RluA family [Desulfosporosinus orientis DSM 765]|uniref:Pseudouridine synthase n=1 Tax=Desulfosporosinus orientis (strain ATCC 19365 / DSM 765 / NCIMB 8382 / VKM B-1628 / Singapore I) TaxID=768706 RepID=G7WGZ4_DESOD|nr:RluA family pseudouridine synthase [Desulfosporosinus orientis]AET69008.1 pseudouridine synthase, RluA family [Desulfosporosinus orientis DSM 765]
MKSFKTYSVAEEHQGLTVEEYLKQILNYSGRKIQKLTRQKGILLNKKTVFLKKNVKQGDVLAVLALEDISFGVEPETGPVEILYEDGYLIVLNKPSGLLVHPTGQTLKGTLSNYLAHYYRQQGSIHTIRPLHRLDRETSGCVLFAKDSHTQALLETALKNGKLKRTYRAVILGNINPPEGTINASIGQHPTKPNRRAVTSKGERAITHYRTIQNLPGASLLDLTLETGRTHQIRVHLTHIGHPIVGDRMYGKGSVLINGQALHAFSLHFPHPFEEREIVVEAPFPDEFLKVLESLNS